MLPMPVKIDLSFNKLHHLGTVPFKLHVSAGAMTTGKMIHWSRILLYNKHPGEEIQGRSGYLF
jgi:hypothetical protein